MHEASPEVRVESGVRWTGAEIVLVLVVGMLCQEAVSMLLDAGGFYRWFYGGDGLKEAVKTGGEAGQVAKYRLGLWAGCAGTLLQVFATLGLLRVSSGTSAEDVGLTTRNLGRNVAAGLLFALIFAPGAYALQWLALLVTRQLGGDEQPHPFTQLGQAGLQPVEWVLLLTAAVALAPLWEELVYRGILQPWVMARQPWGGPVVLAIALAMTVAVRADQLRAAYAEGMEAMRVESLPIVSLLALVVVYLYLASMGRTREVAGLFATAVLFAWVHARVWPSPVPLLWLALGLGWLRWRGRSLAGSIVLHAVFNAVACIVLLVWWQRS